MSPTLTTSAPARRAYCRPTADGAGRARRPAARRPLQLTVIVVCIQGWMPHSNRYVPAGRWSVSVDPGAMNDATVAGGNGMMNSGIGVAPGPNTRLFRNGMNPGPKPATIVNVCSSPPVLVTVSGVPASIVACAGAKRHPPACWLAVSWLTKSPKVTSPSPTHGTGNVAGSHLSLTRIVRPEGGADSAPVVKSKATVRAIPAAPPYLAKRVIGPPDVYAPVRASMTATPERSKRAGNRPDHAARAIRSRPSAQSPRPRRPGPARVGDR